MWRFQDAEVDTAHDLILSSFDALCGEACWGPEHDLAGVALGRELLRHSTNHFDREECLMRAHGYPDLEAHQRAHVAMRREFVQVVEPLLASQASLKEDLQALRVVFLSHLVSWDEVFTEWLGRKSLAARRPESGDGASAAARPDPVRITVEQREGITVVLPVGKLTLGDGDEELGEAVGVALARGARKLVIDFSQVSYLDSSGLGELVGCYTSVKSCGGELRICGTSGRVLTLLKLTSLLSVLDVKETQEEALSAF